MCLTQLLLFKCAISFKENKHDSQHKKVRHVPCCMFMLSFFISNSKNNLAQFTVLFTELKGQK